MAMEIIVGCDMHPQQVAEFSVAAEQAGVREAVAGDNGARDAATPMNGAAPASGTTGAAGIIADD
jgi:hypothetical protein